MPSQSPDRQRQIIVCGRCKWAARVEGDTIREVIATAQRILREHIADVHPDAEPLLNAQESTR